MRRKLWVWVRRVAALMAHELGYDAAWEVSQVRAFGETARGFRLQ